MFWNKDILEHSSKIFLKDKISRKKHQFEIELDDINNRKIITFSAVVISRADLGVSCLKGSLYSRDARLARSQRVRPSV